jgi:hypothetical protein
MIRKSARTFTLALTFATLAASVGKAFAQSATPPPPPPTPAVVTGTNPEPQGVVEMVLVFLSLA